MQIIKNIDELKEFKKNNKNKSIGFVPTMGALHLGHLSLIKNAVSNNDIAIVSIFVNPTQFGVNEDFDIYPRTYQKDIELCKNAGVSAIFMPEIDTLYPNGLDDEVVLIPPVSMAKVFEGAIRENHFGGVLRVILKLFNLISPTNAYFGKKDAQQLLIIKKMVSDLFLDINIIPCDIVRDKNNLALSSRNVYLDSASYEMALNLPNAINKAMSLVLANTLESKIIENAAMACLAGLEVDYCNVVDYNLKKIQEIQKRNSLLIIAVRVGKVRLIDNCWF
ncbi:pantoate--beta-alanine ligase [Helicobacter sp. MIT 99-5507]|uniref:pantoate--beta-alanine ligase n=1 Tax=Helicobacter sp. MIT 99-5507 TaxID=152489 RepID=UPI000E1F3D3B|nr:pantoate--beta-alanine ligase [Helicobacter sp. MIT 99-5507]RDU57354.1 pantoate--beta-alanine ligase [Helicobacter sp. MIT 99-5507]